MLLVQVLLVILLTARGLVGQESPALRDAFTLLQFRSTIWNDSYGSLRNWYLGFSGNACEWTGIGCSGTGQVVSVQLSGLALYGAISPYLADLTQLTKLDLSHNSFMGAFPGQLVKCKELTEINVGYNMLTADLPPELGTLPQLKVLLLNNNNLYGTVPSTFRNLTSLTRLSVAGNMLSGYPFQTLSGLKSLELLDIGLNKFQGSILNQTTVNWPVLGTLSARGNRFNNVIPQSIGSLNRLVVLDVSQNRIEGTIPIELGKCELLASLNLSFNVLHGVIPDVLGKLETLHTLDLRGNSFSFGIPTGKVGYSHLNDLQLSRNNFTSIPAGLGAVPSLIQLDISKNHLEGAIPVGLGSLVSLSYLNLSSNNLSGNIPPQIAGCADLKVLDLSHNLLVEIIPYTIIKMQRLSSLNLSDNQLSGKLPEEVGSLVQLSELDLSDNLIMGTIPAALMNLPRLAVLNFSNNKLSGVIPDQLNFPASSFSGNADLCGARLNKSCTEFIGRTVAPSGMMVSAACLVLTMICIMVLTWWFCCRDDTEGIGSSLPTASLLRRFTAEAIWRATEGFDTVKFLGSTGLCSVYKGEMADGMKVAVKVLCPEYYGGDRKNFAIEAKVFVKVIHPNVVKVIGCCNSINLVALVLEFMSNGSLEKFLYGGDSCELDWLQRLDIILGIAEALAYMHNEWESVLFCDVQPGSILLDEHYQAHISNYRLGGATSPTEHLLTGHLPPEYMFTTMRTREGDVYSYGILVLEILTRISPQGDVAWQGGLAKWVENFHPDALSEVIDPEIMKAPLQHHSIALCTEVALLCTREIPHHRPAMSDVVHMLQRIHRSKELSDMRNRQKKKRRKSLRRRSTVVQPVANTGAPQTERKMSAGEPELLEGLKTIAEQPGGVLSPEELTALETAISPHMEEASGGYAHPGDTRSSMMWLQQPNSPYELYDSLVEAPHQLTQLPPDHGFSGVSFPNGELHPEGTQPYHHGAAWFEGPS